jgi:hypothetical protein
MSESQISTLPTEERPAEIELSGDELQVLTRQPAPPVPPSQATGVPATGPRPTKRAMWRWPVTLACAGAVSIAAIAAGYRVSASDRSAAEAAAAAAIQALEPVTTSVQAQTIEAAPVLFRNPFDKREVFEFPTGTSEQEARDAVADMLLNRAMERQAQYDARHASRRKSSSR